MKNKNPGRALFVSLAVLMLLALQSVSAQTSAGGPTSATSEATAGIFRTDVDNFMSPGGDNSYADIDMEKWFGTLRVENVDAQAANPATELQAGLALKIKDLYFGFFYRGTYSTGTVTEQALSSGVPTGTITAQPTFGGGTWTLTGGSPSSDSGVANKNDIGLLIGFKDMGIKLGFVDGTNRLEVPKVRVNGSFGGLSTGTTYYLRGLNGDMTPSVAWGTTAPVDVGSFSIKPSAELQLKITYDQVEFLDEDGKQVFIDVSSNRFTPLLKLDSGTATLFKGDWGTLGMGIADSFSYVFAGEGYTDSPTAPARSEWTNTLTPYLTFSQAVTPALSFGAKLSVPLGINYKPAAGNTTDDTYTFTLSDLNEPQGSVTNYETDPQRGSLKAGVQYSFVEGKLANKLTLNAGFTILLPEYKYDFTYATEAKAHEWDNGGGDQDTTRFSIQKVTLGAQLHFGPKAMLDFSTAFLDGQGTGNGNNNILENQIWDSLLNTTTIGLTIKY